MQSLLIVGGRFTVAGSVPANSIAAYNPVSGAWSALGSGLSYGLSPTVLATVNALAVLPDGDLVAAGLFYVAGGASASNIARWNGTSWSALGGGIDYDVLALTTLPNGDLVAGGVFTAAGSGYANHIARWNGTSWSAMGGIGGIVFALTTLPNGDPVAGGSNVIARWNGTVWSTLGSGVSYPSPGLGNVYAVTTLPNGDVVAGGHFTTAGGVSASHIARWNGTSWSALGSGMNDDVLSLTTLPNGDLIAGGVFTAAGGVSASHIARWNGTSWSAIGSGTNHWVNSFTTLPNGNLLVGGSFGAAGGVVSPSVAQLATTCPATAASQGSGCAGSGGINTLLATSLPWTGSTFRSTATGMPANGLALGVLGFATASIPLSAILPQGVVGCTLLVSPTFLDLYVPAAGIVTTAIALPNTAALAGQVVHQQVVPLELDAGGLITALTSTNALTLSIGTF